MKSGIPRRKVKLLTKAWVIGDMHFSILSQDLSIRAKDNRSIMVKTFSSSFKKTGNKSHLIFLGS